MSNRRKIDRPEQLRRTTAFARRLAIFSLRLAGFALAVGAVAFGAMHVRRFATGSESLAIESITIEGNTRATEAEIRRLLAITEGDNLLTADLGGARDRVLTHPWIKQVTVDRVFPQGVRISVLEREPVALVDLAHLYLLDESGEAFKRAMPGDPVDLPVITGLPRGEWSARSDETKRRLEEATQALGAWAARDRSRLLPVSEVHVDEAEGVTLYLGDRGFAARLGTGGWDAKLDRLERVLLEVEKRGAEAELVRLDNRARPGWIAARLKPAEERKQATP